MSAPARELKCYWLQGLPACGKTQKALKLVGGGIICDPHRWFVDKPYRAYLMSRAKRQAWGRCLLAAQNGISPIVVDMDVAVENNSIMALKNLEQRGYTVELVEPDSDDWKILKNLMLNKVLNKEALNKWSATLAARQKYFKYTVIRARMNHWKFQTLNDWR